MNKKKVATYITKRLFCIVLFLASAFVAVHAQDEEHFISDANYRAKVEKAFEEKLNLIGRQFYDVSDSKTTLAEREALKFLYAYMPLADATDYATDFYLANVRSSMQARREMSWGQDVPELLWRHFVLPLRVNNEALDMSRIVFFKELKDRVAGMTMVDAILEVNHWCHEHVTYQPSDGRTLSPLACMKNALGRCGEESTFTVAALRSIGIPARQVYTPRWAHTDDNHAWVEAWADGRWWFLGACEPEPVLNLGWFNAPASRAMLMHTRVFGDYDGQEEVMLRTSNFTEINLIDNYGETARIDFSIRDAKGKTVEGAKVEFKIYNYAEFCTVATKYTDKKGATFLTAGKGDMLVWASKDGHYGYTKASFGKDKRIVIRLSFRGERREERGERIPNPNPSPREGSSKPQAPNQMARAKTSNLKPQTSDQMARAKTSNLKPQTSNQHHSTFDIVPPAEKYNLPEVSAEQSERNKVRFAYEDSLRKAYEKTFLDADEAKAICEDAAEMLQKSRSNWRTIAGFIYDHSDNRERAVDILKTLTDKDLRDMPRAILDDVYYGESDELCPRVETEMITLPYRKTFEQAFDETTKTEFRQDPSKLVKWVQTNIRLNPDKTALRIAQTPVGVWRSRVTDSRSRDIFFVDLARSLGIKARKDVVTSKVQYAKDGSWIDVDFASSEQKAARTGTLILDYEPTKLVDDPKYYSHFTITRIRPDGSTQLMNFEEGQVDMGGGTSWSNTFKNGTQLDKGSYMLTTGTRLANGGVMAQMEKFEIAEGSTTRIPLTLRWSDTEISVIGSFDSESKFDLIEGENLKPQTSNLKQNGASQNLKPQTSNLKQNVSVLSQTGRGYFTIGLIGVGQEPTNHALRDIAKEKEAFDAWGRPLLLLFENEQEAAKFNPADYGTLPQNIIFGIDRDGAIRKQIVREMKLPTDRLLPIFIIGDTFNRVVFSSQGYTIGLGEQLMKTTSKLR